MKTTLLLPKKILSLVILAGSFFPTVVFAQWSTAINISPNATSAWLNEDMTSCLAVNGDTIHVVWVDHRSNGHAIWYTQSLDTGLTWSPAIPVTDTSGSASFPSIAVSGFTVHVVWMDTSLGHNASFYKRSLDGGATWGNIFCLDSNAKFWPGLAASGSLVVVSINKEVVTGNTEVYFRRSIDNGTTWDSTQQISNAVNRSEDPSIAALGNDVHLSWNDKRSGTMNIYYRHSADAGLTWGPETQLTTLDSYTSMVCLDGQHVDVPHGIRTGNFDVWLSQSSDTGSNFVPDQQLTFDTLGELYPYMARSASDLHVVYSGSGIWYLHSGDGGATWDSSVYLGSGSQPYIAITGCMLHVIFPSNGVIYYMRNPIGNCNSVATSIIEPGKTIAVKCYPNPFTSQTTIEISPSVKTENPEMKIYDTMGHELFSAHFGSAKKIIVEKNKLCTGIYFYRLREKEKVIAEGKMVME